MILTGVSKAKQMDNSLSYMGIHSLSSYQESKNRLNEAINNCRECKQLESVEKGLFIGIPVLLATGGIGGFAFSGEVTLSSFAAKSLTDASVQASANFSTNGGNFEKAMKNVNLTQSVLAGLGMNYIGNAVVSTAVNINAADSKSVFTGGVSERTYVTQAGLSAVGGAAVQGITSSSVFKSIVVGSYMSTTASLGQTAGTAVANVLMNTPDYTRATLQNNVP
ncbi:RHS repeat-associated core domain-containing protein [Chryseobacterium sp. StRB126]|nr:RHS repeat-associated core domain-containing protein [Chryseobacterium sp. StRB126]